MESFRFVHISYVVSGETLGIVWKRPEHEWRTFVNALHYFAARRCGVPVWCLELLWEYDPWDEAQLPMNVHVKCNISSVFPEIAESTASCGRCTCCWEDCEDLDETHPWNGSETTWEFSYLRNCGQCGTACLCDLCKVITLQSSNFPGAGSVVSCLLCLVTPRGYRRLLDGGLFAETDEDYQVRVAAALKLVGLTEAQQKRWRLVASRDRQ